MQTIYVKHTTTSEEKARTFRGHALLVKNQTSIPAFFSMKPFNIPLSKPSCSSVHEKNLGGRGVNPYYVFFSPRVTKNPK
jgi:hypothetical protein